MSGVVEFGNSDQGIVGHHALVHTVECQARSLRIPEEAALDAKLVAVHTLAIDNVTRAITGHLARGAFAIDDIQIIVLDIGCRTTGSTPLLGLGLTKRRLAPFHLASLDIDQAAALVHGHRQRLVGIGKRRYHADALRLIIESATFLIELGYRKQQFLLACGWVNAPATVVAA